MLKTLTCLIIIVCMFNEYKKCCIYILAMNYAYAVPLFSEIYVKIKDTYTVVFFFSPARHQTMHYFTIHRPFNMENIDGMLQL